MVQGSSWPLTWMHPHTAVGRQRGSPTERAPREASPLLCVEGRAFRGLKTRDYNSPQRVKCAGFSTSNAVHSLGALIGLQRAGMPPGISTK